MNDAERADMHSVLTGSERAMAYAEADMEPALREAARARGRLRRATTRLQVDAAIEDISGADQKYLRAVAKFVSEGASAAAARRFIEIDDTERLGEGGVRIDPSAGDRHRQADGAGAGPDG